MIVEEEKSPRLLELQQHDDAEEGNEHDISAITMKTQKEKFNRNMQRVEYSSAFYQRQKMIELFSPR